LDACSQQTISGQAPEEATDIRICGGISTDGGHTRAFINKLDAKLGTLTNCERLSLSTNCIDKLLPFSGMTKLKILSVGRNSLKRIEKLDDLAGTLLQLWASYNNISSLDGLLPLTNLEVLYMAHNSIKDWAEVQKLATLPNLREVIFLGNPIYDGLDEDTARAHVLKLIPQVRPRLPRARTPPLGPPGSATTPTPPCNRARCRRLPASAQIIKVDTKLITDEHRALAETI